MYKILVVDDEQLHLMGLANMIRKLRNNYTVFEAKNGKEALNVVLENQIDIVVTDVKMPIMDGLEFIEKLGSMAKRMKIVILSGYRDFEYAQKAINLGACDYLIKPVREEKIIQMLNRMEEKIGQELEKIKERENLIKQLNNTLPIYLDHQMNKWINGAASANEAMEISNLFPYKGNGSVLAVEFTKKISNDMDSRREDLHNLETDLKNCMKESINVPSSIISFFLEDKSNIMVTVVDSKDKLDLHSAESLQGLHNFKDNIKNKFAMDVVIGISDNCNNIFSEVKCVLQQALKALSYKFYYGVDKIIFYSDIYKCTGTEYYDISKEEEILKEAIRQGKNDEVTNIVNNLFDKLQRDKFLLPDQLVKSIIHSTLNLAVTIRNNLDNESYTGLLLDIEYELGRCGHLNELRSKIQQLLVRMLEVVGDTKNNKREAILQRGIKYVDEHFMEDISLETVAQKLYFSASYFSTIFKNNMGITFSQYLSQIRIRKAQELLKNPHYKVYEIASKVGYKDDKYFYKVFKKEFGVTPDEYRRLNMK